MISKTNILDTIERRSAIRFIQTAMKENDLTDLHIFCDRVQGMITARKNGLISNVYGGEQEVHFLAEEIQNEFKIPRGHSGSPFESGITSNEGDRYRLTQVPSHNGKFQISIRRIPNEMPASYSSYFKDESSQKRVTEWITCPKTSLIISGQTSSGKTTFARAILEKLIITNRIISIEDPVEIAVPSIIQLEPSRQFKFEDISEKVMRIDPDIIFVGEIRDTRSLDIFSKSITSGHKTITTIHKSASGSLFERIQHINNGQEMKLPGDVVELYVSHDKSSNIRQVQEKQC